jgi:hypothetical protein
MFSELTNSWNVIKETPEVSKLLDKKLIEENINQLKTLFNEEGIVY